MNIIVSICILAYNHEKYIADALESFINQETDFEYEILVHDDASTDRTPEIINYYKDMYPNLIKPIFQTENQHSKGIKILSNYLLPKTQGKYIALCEGDDYWTDKRKLQIQVDFLESHSEYKMVFHSVEVVDTNKKFTNRILGLKTKVSRKATLKELVIGGVVHISSILVLKSLVIKLPPWYHNIQNIGTDFALTMKIAAEGDVFYINKSMSAYRTGVENSMMTLRRNTFTKEKEILLLRERIKVLSDADEYYEYKFHEDVRYINLISEITIAIYEGLFKKKHRTIRKEFIKYHSKKTLIKIYIIIRFPMLCKILIYIRNAFINKPKQI